MEKSKTTITSNVWRNPSGGTQSWSLARFAVDTGSHPVHRPSAISLRPYLYCLPYSRSFEMRFYPLICLGLSFMYQGTAPCSRDDAKTINGVGGTAPSGTAVSPQPITAWGNAKREPLQTPSARPHPPLDRDTSFPPKQPQKKNKINERNPG